MNSIPLHSLVLVIGPSGSGKSTLLRRLFDDYEVVSSDDIRMEMTGDFQRMDYNTLVFEHVRGRAAAKLSLGERAVIDATHLTYKERVGAIELARQYGVPLYYLVVNRPLEDKLATAGWRSHVLVKGSRPLVEHHEQVFRSNEADILRGDGVARVIDTRTVEPTVVRKLYPWQPITDLAARGYRGILGVGDVHGTMDKLCMAVDHAREHNLFLVFTGDVVDYGPHSLECFDEVWRLWATGQAVLTLGNHEKKITRWVELRLQSLGLPAGTAVHDQDHGVPSFTMKLSESNLVTVRQFEALSEVEKAPTLRRFLGFSQASRHHWVFGRTVFVHGAAHPELWRVAGNHRLGGEPEVLAMFGETDGTFLVGPGGERWPRRTYGWVQKVPDGKRVVVGHEIRSFEAPVVEAGLDGAECLFIDTGCGKGGPLSAVELLFTEVGDLGPHRFVSF